MLIQLQDGKPINYPVEESNFRQLFPNISLPEFLSEQDVEHLGFGVYKSQSAPMPEIFEKVIEISPVKDEQGVWVQTWAVVPLNEDELAELTAQKIKKVRSERDNLLASTVDRLNPIRWDTLSDEEKNAWRAYRQALLDITLQPDPFNITWPTQP